MATGAARPCRAGAGNLVAASNQQMSWAEQSAWPCGRGVGDGGENNKQEYETHMSPVHLTWNQQHNNKNKNNNNTSQLIRLLPHHHTSQF